MLLLVQVLGGPQHLGYVGKVPWRWRSGQPGRCGPNPEGRDEGVRQFERNSSPYSAGAGGAGTDMERREEEGEVAAAMVGTGDGRKVTRVRLVWTL